MTLELHYKLVNMSSKPIQYGVSDALSGSFRDVLTRINKSVLVIIIIFFFWTTSIMLMADMRLLLIFVLLCWHSDKTYELGDSVSDL